VKGLLPLLLLAASLPVLLRGRPLFSSLSEGFREGLGTVFRMFPPLAATLTAVWMLRSSGALDALSALLAPLMRLASLPAETAPLLLLRPLSGSGALAAGAEIMERCGVDSLAGRTAAVMLGSTETTFYVVSVYFGAAGIRRTKHAIPAALAADLAAFLCAGIFSALFFS